MARLPYALMEAFTQTPGGGNQVFLILDARGLDPEEMAAIARRLGQETAFVLDRAETSVEVRFFTPKAEVEFSGHAAVALGLGLIRMGLLPEGTEALYLRTPAEVLPVEILYEAGAPKKAWVRGPTPRFRDIPPWKVVREFTEALGSDERYLHRGLPTGIVYTGLWSLFLPFITPRVVDELEPDMEHLQHLSHGLGVATVHAYAPVGARTFYARDFAPLLGIPEDPVTGSANAALGALLARSGVVPRRAGEVELTLLQGHTLERPGVVEVRVEYTPFGEPYRVLLGGEAILLESGYLE
ncbi:MAG: PhzF family phenazine biosynthesis protein [Thermaceae bacterium]